MNKTRILDSSHISWSSFPPQFIENYVVTWSFITRFSVFFSHLVLSTFKRPQQHYLMFIHFCFMYLLYHLYLIFLHLKYLIQDCFTTRYLCGKFLKAVWLIFFFLSLPSVWMTVWPNRKFLIQILDSQYFENITPLLYFLQYFDSFSCALLFHSWD